MIGRKNRPAELGIPRTQTGRSGSGDSGRAGPARRRPPAPPLADHGPTPSTYATTAATAPGHAVGFGAARPGRGRLRPGRGQASVTAPGCSRGRALFHPLGPVAAGGLGSRRRSPYTTTTDTGRRATGSPARPGPYMGVIRGGLHTVRESDRRRRPADRAAGRASGPGLPCVDRRNLRRCGDGGLDLPKPPLNDTV